MSGITTLWILGGLDDGRAPDAVWFVRRCAHLTDCWQRGVFLRRGVVTTSAVIGRPVPRVVSRAAEETSDVF